MVVYHLESYVCFHDLLACVKMFLCLFLCMERFIRSLTSVEVDLVSYSFGEVVNVAFSWRRRNSDAIGPIIPWRSMVNDIILYLLVVSSFANCSDVDFDGV